ncbi:uncharacterized protein LOC126675143 [Mercurialis annua]|uniref:uncharacterized protein LOC126675143 n=1 Tax=Mercurialis annua TaxID=3986 RepID=UPI002160F400|nr:uncharacterized protein LOC126675143 [Mercurialis annua]
MTQVDLVLQAKLLYVELENKKFAFEHCWEILQESIKWQDSTLQKKKSSSMNATSDFQHPSCPSEILEKPISLDSNNDVNESNSERPIGRKAEKESRKKSKVVDTSNSRLCDLMSEFNKQTVETQQRRALAEERKLKVLEEANDRERKKTEIELKIMMDKYEREQQEKDDKIMIMDTSNMDSVTKAYYEHRKAQILSKLTTPTNIESDSYAPLPPSPTQNWF